MTNKEEATLRSEYKDHTRAELLDTVIELEKKIEELKYEILDRNEQIDLLSD